MSDVRLARNADCPEIFELLKIRNAEDGRDPPDTEKVLNAILAGICRRSALIGVIRGPSRIEASIGLYIEPEWDSTAPRVKSRWDFVHPEHRKSSHAKSLVVFGKWAAQELGCPLEISLNENPNTVEKIKMVGRQMPRAGQTFVFPPAA